MFKLPRLHLPELEDHPHCPRLLRQMMTDCLSAFHRLLPAYDCVVPALVTALRRCETSHLFDFGSGSGATSRRIAEEARTHLSELRLTLSDLYPPPPASNSIGLRGDVEVTYLSDPVDLRESRRTGGFRTIFTAFHHLQPEDAKRVLADAVDHKEGIGIFEVTERSLSSLMTVFITPLLTLLLTPSLPFSWMRLFCTYLIPVVPLAVFWDGIASIFRSYSLDELREFASEFPEYDWHLRRHRTPFLVPVTLLIGTPRR